LPAACCRQLCLQSPPQASAIETTRCWCDCCSTRLCVPGMVHQAVEFTSFAPWSWAGWSRDCKRCIACLLPAARTISSIAHCARRCVFSQQIHHSVCKRSVPHRSSVATSAAFCKADETTHWFSELRRCARHLWVCNSRQPMGLAAATTFHELACAALRIVSKFCECSATKTTAYAPCKSKCVSRQSFVSVVPPRHLAVFRAHQRHSCSRSKDPAGVMVPRSINHVQPAIMQSVSLQPQLTHSHPPPLAFMSHPALCCGLAGAHVTSSTGRSGHAVYNGLARLHVSNIVTTRIDRHACMLVALLQLTLVDAVDDNLPRVCITSQRTW
jgi:hypothetical protein